MPVYDPTVPTELCEIMGRNKSDKGQVDLTTAQHNYTTFYYQLFKERRHEPLRVFELGIGTNNVNLPSNMGADGRPGASLYGWAEFFPRAQVFGADIDRDCLFHTERIKTFYCDQTSPHVIADMWSHPDLQESFDIMVEDGLHHYNANVTFMENSIHKLRAGGYYIIEDVAWGCLHLWGSKLNQWRQQFPHLTFDLVTIPLPTNNSNNNLIVVHRPTTA